MRKLMTGYRDVQANRVVALPQLPMPNESIGVWQRAVHRFGVCRTARRRGGQACC